MLDNNYLSVLQFQLKLEIICKPNEDVLTLSDEYFEQMEKSCEVLQKTKPDICIFPEMSYNEKYDSLFRELSENGKLIVFGSTYIGSLNHTMVYLDGKLNTVIKRYPCGSEPMIRFCDNLETSKFLDLYLKEHEFFVNGKKVYILNCLEYYKAAYLIARNRELSSNLFGFIVPCSNSNPKVFLEESMAIHNHNEHIYSFVCNRIKNTGEFGYGRSYIFGPIQGHEKEWLSEEGITSEKHNASILTFDTTTPSYSFGNFALSTSRFGRSDSYLNTPKNLQIKNLL